MDTYAQIQNGIVINITLASSSDTFDPAFTWVDIASLSPQPQINWLYNGNSFAAPGMAQDAYGYSVTSSTVGNNITYNNSAGASCTFPSTTPQAVAYLSLAIQDNIALAENIMESFVQSRYSDDVRLNLIGLVLNAQITGLSGRLAYLSPLLVWQNSIIAYLASYISSVESQTNVSSVVAMLPNTGQFVATDPLLSVLEAIQIRD